MYRAAVEIAGFNSLPLDDRKAILLAITDTLAFANLRFLRSNPGTPRLYQIAPRYDLKIRPLNFDRWADLVQVYGSKSGDCKDFVAIRLAEERMKGNFQAVPWITYKQIRDPRTGDSYESYHVQVACGGQIEDPAALLGMPKNVTIDQIRGLFR